jgi:tetratricopeptide (TPR) repeat protein
MKILLSSFLFCAASAWAQSSADRLLGALSDRSLADQVASMKTDERIAMYGLLAKTKPDTSHYQVLLAGAYVQKARETTDYSYLDRASAVLENVLGANGSDYDAQRLRTETLLERHLFAQAAEASRRLIAIDPADPWNWGTLGDALIEIGDYDAAADAYQKMVQLRPDLASYHRAAHYRFLVGDSAGAIDIMKKAVEAGSASAENVAWCMVELGNIYFKTAQRQLAKDTFREALRAFPNYHPAYAGLGRVLAQAGDTSGAILNYQRAQEITPLPDYAAALYDLYAKSSEKAKAARQMKLLDVIDQLARANGERANRNLVFAFADHGIRLDRALELAQGELEFRRDIYTYDALAWALYQNHRYTEAQQYMEKALKFHTPEPSFQIHESAITTALGRESQ